MPKIILAFFALATLAACNTVEGAGRDLSSAGDAVSSEAQESQ